MRICSTLLLFSLSLMPASRGWAQGAGSIVGTVTDPSTAVIPNARVTVAEEGTSYSRSVETGGAGTYAIPFLRPTRYTVTVEAAGLRKHVQSGVVLLADQVLTVNVSLQLGQTSETVTVLAAGEQVDMQTGTLRQVIEERRMVELPLNGRNAMELTRLVAGSSGASQTGVLHGSTFPNTITISTNGSQANQESYNLDGGNQTDSFTNVSLPFPFPDALQEFSVQTSNYSAQSGSNSGAVVDVITKSGTNQLHGNLFGFLRNRAFNARNSFSDTRDPLTRVQYGFTAGGPVRLPGYNGKDRTFFFGGFQGTRFNTSSSTTSAYVPTDANLRGDFSAMSTAANPANPLGRATQIIDPLNLQPFAGNQIPVSRFDSASLEVLKHLPRAQGNGYIQYSRATRQSFDEFLGKIDHSAGSRDRLSVRYFLDRYTTPPIYDAANLLRSTKGDGALNRVQTAVISLNHLFSPTVINDFRFTFGRKFYQIQNAMQLTPKDIGVNNVVLPSAPYDKLNRIYAPGFFQVITNVNAVFATTDFTWANDLKWTRGRHDLAFGGSLQRTRLNWTGGDNTGSYDFTSDVTGFGLASFVLGKLRGFDQSEASLISARNTFAGVYANDAIRATRRLTLTIGVRWEPGIVYDEIRGRIVTFDSSAYSAGKRSQIYPKAPAGLFYRGDPGVAPNAATSDWNNFAPRFGFAWAPFGKPTTSIRGGSGVFYNQRLGSISMAYVGPPFRRGITITEPAGPFSDPYRGTANPFPLPPLSPSVEFPSSVTLRVYEPGVKLTTPVVYNWNLTIERSLMTDVLARLAYVGSHGSHLYHSLELNSASYIPGSTLGIDARRPFQGYSSIGMNSPEVNSSYNGFQATIEKRMGTGSSVFHSMSVLANYTWSKSIDTQAPGANIAQVSGGGNTRPYNDPLRRSWDRGPSDFDRAHRMVVSYVWDLPRLRHANRWLRLALGNWGVSGILSAQTSAPITLIAGQDRSGTGLGADRVDYRGGAIYGSGACAAGAVRCIDYLVKSAFAVPAVGSFGNVGRGTIRGPNSWSTDMGLRKTIPIAERFRLELRGEFFNALNHPNWGSPTVSLNSGGFGSIRSMSDPRISQVSMKVFF